MSDRDMARLRRYWLKTGDIVYSRRGDVERRALVRPENDGWLCGTGCLRVRVGDESVHDPAYISYALGNPETRAWISRHAVGATMLNLNTSILSAVPLPIPSVDQQRAVAEVLGALDDKIAANGRSSRAESGLAVALTANATVRCSVAEVASIGAKQLKPVEFDPVVDHYSIPAYDVDQMPAADRAREIKSNKQLIDRPVVLLSKLNPRIPRVWDIPVSPHRMALASTEFVVLDPRGVSTSELAACLRQPRVIARLAESVAGTSGSHQRIKPSHVYEAQIPDPRSLADSQRDIVTNLGHLALSRRQENERLSELRDTLLPALMSGRLTVKDAEHTVSEVV